MDVATMSSILRPAPPPNAGVTNPTTDKCHAADDQLARLRSASGANVNAAADLLTSYIFNGAVAEPLITAPVVSQTASRDIDT